MLKIDTYLRNTTIAAPLILLAIVPFALIASRYNIVVDLKIAVLGAVGWWVALVLRTPAIILARKLSTKTGSTLVVLASGPAEEGVRLVMLLALGLTVDNAYSLGLGWAAIEILYSIMQGVALGVLQQKTDKKAEEAKAMLEALGMEKTLSPSAPFWGILERISATALHLGFSLLVVVNPYWVLASAPLHSVANISLLRLARRSLALSELAIFAVAAVIFAMSLRLSL